MSDKSYTLQVGEKVSQVMIGTSDMLLWGDLVTKEQVRLAVYLTTLAEDFVLVRDANILFLSPVEQRDPIVRSEVYVRYEEILFFYVMSDPLPVPEETELRRFESLETVVGSFHIEGSIVKSPMASLQNMLVVTTESYLSLYQASIRHVAKPWLGSFSTTMVQVRLDRLTILSPGA
ncbi:MAG: hypothetical protein PVH11_07135 [Anaerolineae bacterium]|jgi:hypothetical protein